MEKNGLHVRKHSVDNIFFLSGNYPVFSLVLPLFLSYASKHEHIRTNTNKICLQISLFFLRKPKMKKKKHVKQSFTRLISNKFLSTK